jgi:group I intron endonuclease
MFSDKPMIIYFVRLNDKIVYIGQTKLTLQKRRVQHEYNAKRGKGYVLGSAIRKHGADRFIWNIHSVYYNQIDLDAAEKHYILKYAPKYNINLGGESRGVRKKDGLKPWNNGQKGVQVAWNKGYKETRPEVLEKIKSSAQSRDNSNKIITPKHRAKLVEGRRSAYEKVAKPFICDQNGKTYLLVVDAARDLNIPANGIYAVLNPNRRLKSYKGFTFNYIQS